jgi:S1-C subfamily serine protease
MVLKYLFFGLVFTFFSLIGFDKNPPINNLSHPVVLLTLVDNHAFSSAVHIGNGYFLTTNHSLMGRTEVNLLPQGFYEPVLASVVWTSSTYDIAYLYAPELEIIRNYPLSCNDIHIGQELEFHGNPAGLLSISTWGRVAGNPFNPPTPTWDLVVPVDAAIIPGMSGGSVTYNGDLVGIIVGTHIYDTGFAFTFTGISYIVPNTVLCELLSD